VLFRSQQTYFFDRGGKIRWQKDIQGNYLVYLYDENLQLYRINSNVKSSLDFIYDEQGKLVQVSDREEQSILLTYKDGKLCILN
jgi:hypothetical protein